MDRSFRPRHAAFTLASLLAAALTLTPLAARAQPVELKITASDAHRDDYFGSSVAVSGDVAVVGAYEDDAPFTGSGSAYVFRRVGGAWVEEQKLTAADGTFHDFFGTSVAVSGDVVLVGAPGGISFDNGAAYVFHFDGASWAEEEKLIASDAGLRDHFGISVAVSSGVAVVGAHRDLGSGSAYVFRYDGAAWAEEQKLTPSGGSTSDFFGGSVAAAGGVALVGAYGDDDRGPFSGSAYAIYLEAAPVTLAPLAPPVVVPPAGGAFSYAAFVPNNAASPYPFDAWVTATLPGGSPYGPVAGPVHATLPAHVAVARTLRLRVPGQAPPGTYTLTLNVGDYPDAEETASFTFEKAAGEAATRGAPFALVSEGVLFEEAAPATVVPAAGAIAATATLAATPNPSAGRTMLRYALPEATVVRLAVYDVLRREVAVLVDGERAAGPHEAAFDATGLPSGTYLVRLGTGERILTRRVTVAR